MTDLLQVLPDFDTRPYSHLLPSLDKALITTNDLLTLEPAEVAKRAQVPVGELKKLLDVTVKELHRGIGVGEGNSSNDRFLAAAKEPDSGWRRISTLDEELDAALGGGIPPGHLVEITGER
jgi:DNA repair protein RAD57